MKRIIYLNIVLSFLFLCLPPYSFAFEVKDKIKPPTLGFTIEEKVLPSNSNFKVIDKILPPQLELKALDKIPAFTPVDSAPVLSNSPSPKNSIPEKPKKRKSLEELITLAKTDLAKRLGIKIEEILVKNTAEKTWSDTSLGCPEKGKYYAQVITPGYLIILEAKGKTYHYHASLNWIAFCSSPNTTDNPNNATPENQPQRINRLVTSRVNFSFIAQGLKNIFSKIFPFRGQ